MRLIAEIGYRHVVFAKDANYGAIIEALGTATVCETNGYGAEMIYVPVTDATHIKVELANDAAVKVSGEEGNDTALLDRVLALSKANTDLTVKVYNLETKLKAANAATA